MSVVHKVFSITRVKIAIKTSECYQEMPHIQITDQKSAPRGRDANKYNITGKPRPHTHTHTHTHENRNQHWQKHRVRTDSNRGLIGPLSKPSPTRSCCYLNTLVYINCLAAPKKRIYQIENECVWANAKINRWVPVEGGSTLIRFIFIHRLGRFFWVQHFEFWYFRFFTYMNIFWGMKSMDIFKLNFFGSHFYVF